ncbi:MAG: beta-hydroxyacyl-ACP dehydratase [Planctomycetaceae bacterium]|nr:MAG: beta-hydroxyacyl-ACP dehydratase [Planctomycetaceae bacterium]
MKFHLVDKIISLEPGKRIETIKALSLAEEYLADHFPAFPVLPGVMMLEALVQSAAWLVRVQQNFSKSIIVLGAARNVRYANFVAPGNIMTCKLEAMEITDSFAKFKGEAFVEGNTTVTGRLELRCFNLADKTPHLAEADKAVIEQLKSRWKLVHGPEALAAVGV